MTERTRWLYSMSKITHLYDMSGILTAMLLPGGIHLETDHLQLRRCYDPMKERLQKLLQICSTINLERIYKKKKKIGKEKQEKERK